MIGNIGYERRLQALERRAREIGYGVPSPLTAFSAGLYQGGSIACTVSFAVYMISGKWMVAQAFVQATAGGVAGNTIALTGLPFPPLYYDTAIGSIEIKDQSAGIWYSGVARCQGGFGSGLYVFGISDANNNTMGISPAVTIAAGDQVCISISTPIA